MNDLVLCMLIEMANRLRQAKRERRYLETHHPSQEALIYMSHAEVIALHNNFQAMKSLVGRHQDKMEEQIRFLNRID